MWKEIAFTVALLVLAVAASVFAFFFITAAYDIVESLALMGVFFTSLIIEGSQYV